MSAVESVVAALGEELDGLWAIGGNFLTTLPGPVYCAGALDRISLRVRQGIVLTPQIEILPLAEAAKE